MTPNPSPMPMSEPTLLCGLCFTLDHDRDEAARRFVARFGKPHQRTIERDGKLWLLAAQSTEGVQP